MLRTSGIDLIVGDNLRDAAEKAVAAANGR
jgi:hypothetical protein